MTRLGDLLDFGQLFKAFGHTEAKLETEQGAVSIKVRSFADYTKKKSPDTYLPKGQL